MRNRFPEFIDIGMYKDTAASYGLCEDDGISDNEVVLTVPSEYVENYFYDVVSDDYTGIDAYTWYNDEYTYDDMEGFLSYVIDNFGNLDSVEVSFVA